MNIREQKLKEILNDDKFKSKVSIKILEDLSTIINKPFGNYYYNLMCGSGKTISLALLRLYNPKVRLVYCTKSNQRLLEFSELLKEFRITHLKVNNSKDFLRFNELDINVLLMTTSMLLQVSPTYINNLIGTSEADMPVLVIDELPDVINKIEYNVLQLFLLSETYEKNKETLQSMDPLFKSINRSFSRGDITLSNDLAINTDKNDLGNSEISEFNMSARTFIAKFLFDRISSADLEEKSWKDELQSSIILSIKELFLSRFCKTLVLDATADLYADLIDAKPLVAEIPDKNYNDYINSVYNLRDFVCEIDKKYIIENFSAILIGLSAILPEDEDSYIVTHNSALYEDNGDIKEELLETLQIYFSNHEIEKLNDKDAIVIKDDKRTIYLANYNRNRGTNYFRNCKNVVLLGEFKLPFNDLSQLVRDNNLARTPETLSLNLSIADAVQEISRGCLRKRDSESKETVYLLGGNDWMKGVCNYLGVAPKMLPPNKFNYLVKSCVNFLLSNKEDLRKSSYVELVKLILRNTELSASGKISRQEINNEIESSRLPKRLYDGYNLRLYFSRIGLDYDEIVVN